MRLNKSILDYAHPTTERGVHRIDNGSDRLTSPSHLYRTRPSHLYRPAGTVLLDKYYSHSTCGGRKTVGTSSFLSFPHPTGNVSHPPSTNLHDPTKPLPSGVPPGAALTTLPCFRGIPYCMHALTMRLGVTLAVTMVVLSIVIVPPPASATVRYGCFLNPRPPAHAPSTSWK